MESKGARGIKEGGKGDLKGQLCSHVLLSKEPAQVTGALGTVLPSRRLDSHGPSESLSTTVRRVGTPVWTDLRCVQASAV